jgi:hypothetical protein
LGSLLLVPASIESKNRSAGWVETLDPETKGEIYGLEGGDGSLVEEEFLFGTRSEGQRFTLYTYHKSPIFPEEK